MREQPQSFGEKCDHPLVTKYGFSYGGATLIFTVIGWYLFFTPHAPNHNENNGMDHHNSTGTHSGMSDAVFVTASTCIMFVPAAIATAIGARIGYVKAHGHSSSNGYSAIEPSPSCLERTKACFSSLKNIFTTFSFRSRNPLSVAINQSATPTPSGEMKYEA